MIGENARQVPVLVLDDKEGVRLDMDTLRAEWEERKYRFVKKYAIAAACLVGLIIWTVVACAITAAVVRKKTTESVTSELRAGFQQYLRDQDYQNSAANFLTGEASFEAALDADSEWGARLIYGYLTHGNITTAQAKAIICCVEARANSGYDSSFQNAVRHEKQWQWYSDDNPVRDEDKELVKSVLRDLRQKKYPNGFTDQFIYMEWQPGDVVLRNEYTTNSKTKYWRYPE